MMVLAVRDRRPAERAPSDTGVPLQPEDPVPEVTKLSPVFAVRDLLEIVLVRHATATGQEANAALTIEGQQQARLLADLQLP